MISRKNPIYFHFPSFFYWITSFCKNLSTVNLVSPTLIPNIAPSWMEPLDAKACLFLSFDKNKLTPVIHKNCAYCGFHELCQRSLQKKIKTLAPIPRLSNQGCKQKNPARDARGSSFRLFELFNSSRAVEKYHWRDFQRPHSNRPFWHQYIALV